MPRSLLPLLLTAIIITGNKTSFAQDKKKIDSLNKILNTNIPDTSRCKIFIGLAGEYLDTSPSTSISYCEQSLALSEKINFDEGIGEAAGWLAYLNEQDGNIAKAIAFNYRALEMTKKTHDEKGEATIYSNLAAIYKDQGDIDSALTYNEKSLVIRQKLNDKDGIATSYNNLGLLNFNQGKIPEALDFYFKSLSIEEGLKSADGVSTALGNIAAVYRDQQDYEKAFEYYRKDLALVQQNNDKYSTGYALNGIGNIFFDTKNLDSALIYYQRALKVREEISDQQGQAYSLKNIGNVYSSQKKFPDAIDAFQKSLSLFTTVGDKWGTAIVTSLLGKIFLNEGKIAQAESMLNQSLQLSKELGYPADISNAAEGLQNVYRNKNQWKDALLMNDLFIKMRDSVANDRNRKEALKTQFKYEYEKKEALLKKEQEKKDALAQEQIARQKLIRNGFIGGFVVVLLFAGIFFRQRNKISKEKKRSDELLLNILPQEVADELKQNGKTTAKDFSEVTVLFTDFKNFTAMSEKLSAQELVNEINYCYSAFDRIISKHGIEKIKTIGDSYMCAGGLPVANRTNAVDTVAAAVEIRDFIEDQKNKRKEAGLPYFEIRIGCNTGPVVAGIVGIKKFAYDIWGDTVNIASRMESSGEVGKVNISGSTYELVKDKFACTYRGKVQAKNKGEIDMYFADAP